VPWEHEGGFGRKADREIGGPALPRHAAIEHQVRDAIGERDWAVYASRSYIARHGRPERLEDLDRHRVVSLDEAMSRHRLVGWLKSVTPNATIAARNNSILGLMQAVKSGLGVSALPIPLAEQHEELVRLFGPVTELSRSWRLLTHPDLRRTRRVALFFDFIVEKREALRPILTG
jgi:DNA-binding transcriptional LysR family regulator